MKYINIKAGKLFLGLVIASLIVQAFMPLTLVSAQNDDDKSHNYKVWVCKFVSTPGEKEVLKNGNNGLIEVSVNAIKSWDQRKDIKEIIGYKFNDAQGYSKVIKVSTGKNSKPDRDDCFKTGEIISVCDLDKKPKPIEIKIDRGLYLQNTKRYSLDLNKCKADDEEPKTIEVCELDTKTVITIDETKFNTSKHSKNLDDCKELPVVEMIEVCELATKTVITIDEADFDEVKYSKDANDCEADDEEPKTIEVCELDTKKVITIDEADFDEVKYSKDTKDCVIEPGKGDGGPQISLPTTLPKTGNNAASTILTAAISSFSLVSIVGVLVRKRLSL